MNKTKWLILGGFSFYLAISCLILFPIKSAKADTSTTFPVDEAGIAAYVKVDSIENIDIGALAEGLHSVERQAESYVIGTVKVGNSGGADYPHIYIGMDGWIVAYYLKTEEASRIMQWRDSSCDPITISTKTTLKDAIDIICQKTGVSYSTPVKYYDFEFPEANKMTLIAEGIGRYWLGPTTKSYYVTVPGTLYEASYAIRLAPQTNYSFSTSLKVDDTIILEKTTSGPFILSGYFDPLTYFKASTTHYVTFSRHGDGCGWFATVLIYKNLVG